MKKSIVQLGSNPFYSFFTSYSTWTTITTWCYIILFSLKEKKSKLFFFEIWENSENGMWNLQIYFRENVAFINIDCTFIENVAFINIDCTIFPFLIHCVLDQFWVLKPMFMTVTSESVQKKKIILSTSDRVSVIIFYY